MSEANRSSPPLPGIFVVTQAKQSKQKMSACARRGGHKTPQKQTAFLMEEW